MLQGKSRFHGACRGVGAAAERASSVTLLGLSRGKPSHRAKRTAPSPLSNCCDGGRLRAGLPLFLPAGTRPITSLSAAAAPVGTPAQHSQDPQVIISALCSPVATLCAPVVSSLGGEGSWQYYLAVRFAREVLAVVVAALLGYWLLTKLAARSAEVLVDSGPGSTSKRRSSSSGTAAAAAAVGAATAATAAAAGTAGATAVAAAGAAVGAAAGSHGGGELLRLAAAALTGPQARLFLAVVLLVNVARTTTYIFDGFITKFNPRLPNDWLDDLVRLVAQGLAPLDDVLMKLSLVGTALFGCAVLLRWKDVAVARLVRSHIEGLDKGQELVQNFVNPASNLLNWVVIVASVLWLATGLGLNLKPLLAVGGASGIIIGLATQQVLGNFVSGLNIFLARPFVAGEYISLSGVANVANVSGRVIRVDPMRTLIATEDGSTISVPNQVIAVSIVINRSRTPHWSVGSASPLLANPRELRWRMKLSHAALDRMEELEARIEEALASTLPPTQVRHTPPSLELVRFTDSGAEVVAKVNLAWRLRGGGQGQGARELYERQETQELLLQTALLALHKVVRSCDGSFLT